MAAGGQTERGMGGVQGGGGVGARPWRLALGAAVRGSHPGSYVASGDMLGLMLLLLMPLLQVYLFVLQPAEEHQSAIWPQAMHQS